MTLAPLGARTLLDYFRFAEASGKPDLLVSRTTDGWTPVSADRFGRTTRSLALGLSALGIEQGDRVAILSENRPEWAMTDFATLSLGAMTIPVYATYLAPQVEYILRDCRARAVVVSGAAELAKVLEVRGRCPDLAHVVAVSGAAPGTPGVVPFASVVERGEALLAASPGSWDERAAAISPDTHATIIYTSGTTGEPKGAVLTHDNFVSNVKACSSFFEMGRETVALSFLPLAHVFQRMIDYVCFSRATTVAYVESIDKLGDAFREVRPHCFAAVPRVYEKILERVRANVEASSPSKQRIFEWAVGLGRERVRRLEKGLSVPSGLELRWKVADRLVFRKIRERLGDRFRFCIAAGAPLSREVAEFFWGAGIEIYEGYGLTETSPTLTCNRPGEWRLGTVGRPIPGVILKIAPDGEVLARGPNVMKGYWGKPAETEKSIDADGWFCTGDVGHVDREGFLTLTDRKKELLVTAYGANVAPGPVEGALKQVRYIASAVLVGNGRKFLSALVVPNFERLEPWAAANGVEFRSREELIRSPKVRALFQKTVDLVNGDEPPEKRIRAFALLANDFTIEGGELTPTLKVRRTVLAQKYARLIDAMYEAAEASEMLLGR